MIVHILSRADWQCAVRKGVYAPESLRTEGFVHCSTPVQALKTANRFFRGQRDLLMLCVNELRLSAIVRLEGPVYLQCGSQDEFFPHVYGTIDLEAVVQVVEFPCEVDGSFRLPPEFEKAWLTGLV